jgi:predicted PurR-regulated permease PerM
LAEIPGGSTFPVRRLAAWVMLAVAASTLLWVAWQARSLILPLAAGALLAYFSRPAVGFMEQRRVPRAMAIALLVALALGAATGAVHAIRSVAPSEEAIAQLKVRAARVTHERYAQAMGLDDAPLVGNHFYRLVHQETDPLLARIDQFLALDSDEGASVLGPGSVARPLGTIAHALPGWIVAFLIFVFVLMDTGEIKRGLLSIVPNRFFEPVLSILSDLENTLRRYARAVFIQCVLLGITVAATQMIAGIPFRWAIVTGFFAGMANVMPYAGISTALVCGLAYALLGDEIRSPFPFIDADNFPVAVLIAVLATDAIKNIVYDPKVIGGAMGLHPVVIVIGVAVGGEMFGIVGALLAVPAIAFAVAFVTSVFKQLRAYGEI